jgi:hypothetical protein
MPLRLYASDNEQGRQYRKWAIFFCISSYNLDRFKIGAITESLGIDLNSA